MPIGKWILLLASVAVIATLTGCGDSTTNVQNQPSPPASSVSIAFQPAPAGSLSQISTTKIAAVVSNDPSSAGVDWALLCQDSGNCGTLGPLHTASGASATYTPPLTPSSNVQPITVEAFATADHSKNVVATINVTGFAGMLKGTYVFETKGEGGNGNSGAGLVYQLAGVIVLDGDGNVTSGEQTRNGPVLTASNPSGLLVSNSDTITGGSYSVGPDGRGTLTLNTADQNIGQQGIENFSLVALSSSQVLISTLDSPSLTPSAEISSGTLQLQTNTSAPAGGYAFVVDGDDIGTNSEVIGGILNIDSPNTISGTGSVADQEDNGTLTASAPVSGTLTKPDSFGSLKFNLTTGFSPLLQFTGYIVDATHINLIESDNNSPGGGGSTSGVAIGQGAATGAFTSFSGNYVFDILGQESSGPTALASLGQFTADTSGNLSGYNDEDIITLGIEISDSFTGTYAVDPTGTGRVDSTIAFTTNGPGPELIFYLTGTGSPPLVLYADASTGSLGLGSALGQAVPPFSFSGNYGTKFVQTSSTGSENRATGEITANATSGTLTGVIDVNENFGAGPNATTLTGTFGATDANGRSTGTLADSSFPSPGTTPNTIAVAYYFVNASKGFFIETDSQTSFTLNFGSFSSRTSVCPSCP